MWCPRCGALLHDHAQIVDGPNGIVAVLATPVSIHRRHCICGHFTWTVASSTATSRQPNLTLIGAA